MDEKYKVLVTGIGGNVGQGIMRNIACSGIEIEVIGTNVVGFSAGNHLAQTIYETPYAYEPNYIGFMKDIVTTEQVDLIIPSTDFEVYYLSLNKAHFSCDIAVSEASICEIYLDKYLTWKHHQKNNLPFAASILPSESIPTHWKATIAKPRKGRGSRGIVLNPKDVSAFSDEEYMIQEYIEGDEITTAVYVDLAKKFHGMITMTRTLENGTTVSCEVVDTYDDQLEPLIKGMMKENQLSGSFNIQSRINNQGEIVPFEINCRVSGTNSIRSQFGFCDVTYLLQEYLLKTQPEKPQIKKGKAVRILMDVIFPDCSSEGVAVNAQTPHFIF